MSRAVRLLSSQGVNESSLDSHVSVEQWTTMGRGSKTGAVTRTEAVRPARRAFALSTLASRPFAHSPVRRFALLALRGQHFKRLLDVIRA